jgi:hypothetical protein
MLRVFSPLMAAISARKPRSFAYFSINRTAASPIPAPRFSFFYVNRYVRRVSVRLPKVVHRQTHVPDYCAV